MLNALVIPLIGTPSVMLVYMLSSELCCREVCNSSRTLALRELTSQHRAPTPSHSKTDRSSKLPLAQNHIIPIMCFVYFHLKHPYTHTHPISVTPPYSFWDSGSSSPKPIHLSLLSPLFLMQCVYPQLTHQVSNSRAFIMTWIKHGTFRPIRKMCKCIWISWKTWQS